MKRNYMAFCNCGGLVALATAHTIDEIADNGKEAKKWEKQGFRVELRESTKDEPMPRWCGNPKAGTCEPTLPVSGGDSA
jgi:hypothetical protein